MKIGYLPFLLLIVPVAEISAFVLIGGEIGVLATIALVLLTAVLGTILLRIEGFRTLKKITDKINAGSIPSEELGNGAMILVAGILLLTPGFISDSIGFSLFVPGVRKIIWKFLVGRIRFASTAGYAQQSNNHSDIQNPDIVELDPNDFLEEPKSSSPWFDQPEKRQ